MLDAIIVEPALDKRTNLREIARNFCNSVVASSTLQDALERVRNSKNCDVIYISSRFDLEAATQFVASIKQTDIGQDSANLLIGSADNFSASLLARLTLKGFDGMLLEPASVDTFSVSAELALKARKAKLQERQKRSIELMVKSLAEQLDEVVIKKKLKQVTILSQDRFNTLCKEIRALDFSTHETYFNALVEQFIARPIPADLKTSEYTGSSLRMQRRMLSK